MRPSVSSSKPRIYFLPRKCASREINQAEKRKKKRKIEERKKIIENVHFYPITRITYWSITYWKIIHIIYSIDAFAWKSRWDLKLENHNLSAKFLHFHEYPFLQTIKYQRLSSPEIHFTRPQCSSHIPIKLATPPLKFICQDLITVPTRPSPSCIPLVAPPNNRHVCGNKETLQTFAPTLPISAWQTNLRQTWGEWLVEETDKDDRSRRYRASHAPESSSRPSSTLIVPVPNLPTRDFDRCSTMWIPVIFFFFFYSNSNVTDRLAEIRWKKDGMELTLGDVKFFQEDKIFKWS